MSEEPIFVGEYELRNCVATGNVSQIWEVVERGATQHFAMKLLLEEAFAEAQNKTTLKQEFKIGQLFEHPNIIRFHKLEINRDHAFFIMDYFRAPSLKSAIAQGLTDVNVRFKKLGEAVILALSSIHEKGWLHRDIKPENILLNRGSEVRLIDFSLATKQSGALGRMFGNSKIQGTRTYIAPETLQKQKPVPQTDMYSLGITLYEALAGHPPFRGTSPNDLLKKHMLEIPTEPSFTNPNITPEGDNFVLRMLKKKPQDRHADMKELYTEFRGVSFFKEDPAELAERKRQEAEQEKLQTVDQRLDSRLDAERKAAGITAPVKKKKKKPKILLKDLKKEEAAAAAAEPAATPVQQPPMQQPMPYPQQPMPGYMPQQPMYPQPGYMPQPMYPQQQQPMYPPQQPMPYPPQQAPMPPGYQQQQPMPGQPMPGQPMPPQPMPGQQIPGPPVPQQPMPGQPTPGQQMPGPPVPQQPSPQPPPAQDQPAQPQEPRHRLPLERPQAPQVPADVVADELEEFTDLDELNIE